jgi:hypothetical protein
MKLKVEVRQTLGEIAQVDDDIARPVKLRPRSLRAAAISAASRLARCRIPRTVPPARWGRTFSAADGVLDFLAAGKTPVQKYNVTVGDNMAAPWCRPSR